MDTNIEILKGLSLLIRGQKHMIYLLNGLQSRRVVEDEYHEKQCRQFYSETYYFNEKVDKIVREHELKDF